MIILLKRFFAFYIDLMITCVICSPFIMVTAFKLYLAFLILVPVLFVLRDVSGCSVGKRILNLKIVAIEDGKALSVGRLIVRNLTTLLWPMEALIAYLNKGRRLGDLIAKSRVIE